MPKISSGPSAWADASTSLIDPAAPLHDVARGYAPPASLFSPLDKSQQALKTRVESFVRTHSVSIGDGNLLRMNLRGMPYDRFIKEAHVLCKALFGPDFRLPSNPAAWSTGETYAPPQCETKQRLMFSLEVNEVRTDSSSTTCPARLSPLRAPDLQVGYLALSLCHGAVLLSQRDRASEWSAALECTRAIKQLRAAERASIPDTFRRHVENRNPLASAIRRSIENGNNTVVSICDDLSRFTEERCYSRPQVREKLSQLGFSDLRIANTRLNELLAAGERDIGYLCQMLDLTPLALWTLFRREPRSMDCVSSVESGVPLTSRDLSYRELTPFFDCPVLEALVRRGASLEEIGRTCYNGATREYARQQLEARNINAMRTRQRRLRHQIRKGEMDVPETLRRDLIELLATRALTNATGYHRWAIAHHLQPGKRHAIETLINIYRAVEQGRELGWSLPRMAKEAGVPYPTLYQALRTGPFPEFFTTRKHSGHLDYDAIMPRITRCFELGFSLRSIERFLGCRITLISGSEQSSHREDYHRASLVYEAQDLGYTAKETAELLETDLWRVIKALDSRSLLEPKIIEGLRVLFNEPTMSRPYRPPREASQSLPVARTFGLG